MIETYFRTSQFAASTVRNKRLVLYKFLDHLGDIQITDVGIRHITEFNTCIPPGKATLRDYRKHLRAFFRWLRQNYDLPTLDPERIALPRSYDEPWQTLSTEELGKIRAAILKEEDQALRKRDQAMFELMYWCGLRRAEVLTITPKAVNFELGEIRIHGKGDKPRDVFISPMAKKALQAYLSDFETLPDPIFPISSNALYERFQRWAERAGLRHIHPHMLRKRFATDFFNETKDIRATQTILGHSKPETTQRYVNVEKEDVRSAYQFFAMDKQKLQIVHERNGNMTLKADVVFAEEGINIDRLREALYAAIDSVIEGG
jgi:site-specific recombinase XerD